MNFSVFKLSSKDYSEIQKLKTHIHTHAHTICGQCKRWDHFDMAKHLNTYSARATKQPITKWQPQPQN